MWIYIIGCIVALIALIITHLKYKDILTIGELMLYLLFSLVSWGTLIAVFIEVLLVELDFNKPIIKRKK